MKTQRISGVYLLRVYSSTSDTRSPKVYIGSSIDIYSRIKNHIRMLVQGKHHSYKLQSFFNKTTEPVLELQILTLCSVEELPKVELKHILEYNSVRKGFNCTYDVRRRRV